MASDGFRDYSPGDDVVLKKGNRYVVVYRPDTLGATLHADKETVGFAVGGRRDVAVENVKVDFFDSEVHVTVQIDATNPLPVLLPVKLQIVPTDELTDSPVGAIGNLMGVEGVAVLDRIKGIGPAEASFEEAEAAEERADERLDEGNLRNTIAGLMRRVQQGGQLVTAAAVVGLSLLVVNVVQN